METIENIHVFNAILLAVVVTVIGIVGGGRKFYCVKFFFVMMSSYELPCSKDVHKEMGPFAAALTRVP